MKCNSKVISSNQPSIHDNLENLVKKHMGSVYRKPIQKHNREAFDAFCRRMESNSAPLILDSCCGTGKSSEFLARKFPEHRVVGLDQSALRLSKLNNPPENLELYRVNCEDFWRLCVEHDIQFERHYILYANPWPKKAHLKRRWHGHPVFPILSQIAPQTHLRANWKTYLDEFSLAWNLLTGKSFNVGEFIPTQYMTLFEKKYFESGQSLYQLTVDS